MSKRPHHTTDPRAVPWPETLEPLTPEDLALAHACAIRCACRAPVTHRRLRQRPFGLTSTVLLCTSCAETSDAR